MDLTGFEILRETLRPYLGSGAAHREAQQLLPKLTRALRNGPPLPQELSSMSKLTLSESVQRTFEGVADEVRYYYAAEPFGYEDEDWDRGMANPEVWRDLPILVRMVEVLVPNLLEAIGREDPLGAIKHTAGAVLGTGAGDGYPLCIQTGEGKPVTVCFPGVIRQITGECPTLVPLMWNDESVADFEDPLGLVFDVLLKKREPRSDAEWFQWVYQATTILIDILGSLAAMQWIVCELAASYLGIESHEVEAVKARLAAKFGDEERRKESTLEHLPWKMEAQERTGETDEVDMATGIRLVGKALRHAMLDEPFEVPVVSTRLHEDPNGQTNRLTITVNHPLVGMGDVASVVRRGLLDFRKLDTAPSLLLSLEEAAFMDAVGSLRWENNLRGNERVPRGFWKNFTQAWNADHPEDLLTENAARVRHHRLKSRSQSLRKV